ncbi:hypothetical protein FHR33_001468 [Nonomuraea dietziae]|uniref:Uncharacterized protein n=1 Tax=Nonomuraea dietziae TaxID=65515 RepID=A0A7W5V3G4_9ACTN|nr:hypothetical protein [Nonomuraea dietziae]
MGEGRARSSAQNRRGRVAGGMVREILIQRTSRAWSRAACRARAGRRCRCARQRLRPRRRRGAGLTGQENRGAGVRGSGEPRRWCPRVRRTAALVCGSGEPRRWSAGQEMRAGRGPRSALPLKVLREPNPLPAALRFG